VEQKSNLRERLLWLIKQKSVHCHSTPSFSLSSGKKSRYYFDLRPVLLQPEGLQLIGQLIWQCIQSQGVEAVGGLLSVGAAPVVCAALMSAPPQAVGGFLIRKEAKPHGLQKRLEGDVAPGMRVAVVDDVLTSGGSLEFACRQARAHELEVVQALVLLDRQEGGLDKIAQLGIPCQALFTAAELLK